MCQFDRLLRERLENDYPGASSRHLATATALATELHLGVGSAASMILGVLPSDVLLSLIEQATGCRATLLNPADFDIRVMLPVLTERFADQLRRREFVPLRFSGSTLSVAFAGPDAGHEQLSRRMAEARDLLEVAYKGSRMCPAGWLSNRRIEPVYAPRGMLHRLLDTMEFIRTCGHAPAFDLVRDDGQRRELLRPGRVQHLQRALASGNVSLGATRMALRVSASVRILASTAPDDIPPAAINEFFRVFTDAVTRSFPINAALHAFGDALKQQGIFHSFADNLSVIHNEAARIESALQGYHTSAVTRLIDIIQNLPDNSCICGFGNPSSLWNRRVVELLTRRRIRVVHILPDAPVPRAPFAVHARHFVRALELDASADPGSQRFFRVEIARFEESPGTFLGTSGNIVGVIGSCHGLDVDGQAAIVCERSAAAFIDTVHRSGGIVYTNLNGIKAFDGFGSARDSMRSRLNLVGVESYLSRIGETHTDVPRNHPGLQVLT